MYGMNNKSDISEMQNDSLKIKSWLMLVWEIAHVFTFSRFIDFNVKSSFGKQAGVQWSNLNWRG